MTNLTKDQKEVLIELIEDKIYMNEDMLNHGIDVDYYKNINEDLNKLIKLLQ